jgi:hypothetical protein
MSSGFNVRAIAAEIASISDRTARTFPRDMEAAALFLPVHVERIQHLTLGNVDTWLRCELDWSSPTNTNGRPLRGCLIAHRGQGIIFLEASETIDQQRFTLAHELAHFIGHYLGLRDTAIARLGPSIVAALDGDRAPTSAERLSGVE